MDIFTEIKADHDRIINLLARLENEPHNKELFLLLEQLLIIHNQAEEKAFYVPLKKKTGRYRIVSDASEKEHQLITDIINYINITELDEQECETLIPFLKRTIAFHFIKEEEYIFSLANQVCSHEELNLMSEEFQEEKENIIKPHLKTVSNDNIEELLEEATETVIPEQEDA